MSTFMRGVNLSKKWLKITLFALLAVVCATAITLAVVLSGRDNYVVTPETESKVEVLDSSAIVSKNGWNNTLLAQLTQNVTSYGDNVALGNAGGDIVSSVVELGGISWTVVYMQDGIVTLYANEAVATMPFGSAEYKNSLVRDYLINEFYPEFIEKIGYTDIEKYIIPYGQSDIYYQADGAQAVVLSTLNGGEISGNDGVANDMVWLPSAYEVGGFANNDSSPKSRVNSFKVIEADGFTLNSGLFNTSNTIRLMTDTSWLRSSVNGAQSALKDGVVKQVNDGEYAVRPCINIALPGLADIVEVNEDIDSSNDTILATVAPDYSDIFKEYSDNQGEGTQASPYIFSDRQFLIYLSDAVMAGQDTTNMYFQMADDIDMAGVTVWSPIGREGFPFKGYFDGNGYTVSNLASAGSGLVGLFGYVENAVITQVGVTNSSWYTTNSNVGGIAGHVTNSLISECYSDCGVGGYNYVGGLVGRIVSSTSTDDSKGIINCYNLNGITGRDYVGGIAGEVSASLVKNCYNTGATQAINSNSSCGGITGALNNSLGTSSLQNCVFYNSTDNNLNGDTPISSYDTLRNKDAIATTYPGWSFRNNASNGVWFMSNVVNDRLPMLYCFMHNVSVNLISNIPECSVSAGTTDAQINSTLAIVAYATSTTNEHYMFEGWYHFDVDAAGNKIEGSERPFVLMSTQNNGITKGALSNNAYPFTYNLVLDDYYNLEARFVKLYNFEVSPMFNGFTSNYTGGSTFSYTADHTAYNTDLTENPGSTLWTSSSSPKWYPEGTVITINIQPDAQRQYYQLNVGHSSTNVDNQVDNLGEDNPFYNLSSGENGWTYNITIRDTAEWNGFDVFYFRPMFNRVYALTTSVTTPSKYTETTPISQVTFTNLSNGSTTISSSGGTATDNTIYTSTLTLNISNLNDVSGKLVFSSWILEFVDPSAGAQSSQDLGSSVGATNGQYALTGIQSAVTDTTTGINIRANFNYATKQVSIREMYNSAKNSNAGYVYLSTEDLKSGFVPTQDITQLTNLDYNSTVYIYILPNYAGGFQYSSNTIPGANLTLNSSTGVTYGSFVVNFTESSATYDVVYTEASNFALNFNVTLNGTTPPLDTFQVSSNATGLTLNSPLSSYTVTVLGENEYRKYYMRTVRVAFIPDSLDANRTTIITYTPSGIYQGTQGAQSIFAGLGANAVVNNIYTQANVTPSNNNTTIYVYINYITITRTINVTEYINNTLVTSPSMYSISATGVTNGKGGSDYILEDTITLTAGATGSSQIGFKVDSITMTPNLATATINGSTWGNSGTLTFELTEDVSISIYYTQRPYNITIGDNLHEDDNYGDTIPILGITATNNFNYTLTGGASTQYDAPFTGLFSNSLTINGYQTQIDLTIDDLERKAVLNRIVVLDSNNALLKEYDPASQFTYTLNDANDNIKIVFQYQLLQALNVTFSDEVTGGSNAALVVLENVNDSSDRLVLIVPAGQDGVTVDCQVAEYRVTITVAIFVQTDVNTTPDGSGSVQDGNYQISIADGQATSVAITVQNIINGVDSVFASGSM